MLLISRICWNKAPTGVLKLNCNASVNDHLKEAAVVYKEITVEMFCFVLQLRLITVLCFMQNLGLSILV